eukprot:CAMPEP_0115001100 /NCGR_PEP_ID=MMETSP0216-20121206/17163_1 /TAXON_ID=223996 /ORGANISM="Protocruzia adherens, Strain Boccale" /LENGTH=109 /DNA_ID=CAMNT_0002366347 /DNA_START=508 /DNA_END=837 /DNA_ORIENTATION=+
MNSYLELEDALKSIKEFLYKHWIFVKDSYCSWGYSTKKTELCGGIDAYTAKWNGREMTATEAGFGFWVQYFTYAIGKYSDKWVDQHLKSVVEYAQAVKDNNEIVVDEDK